MPQIRIGISGWRYAPWRGRFYPPKLPHRAELEYAARKFNAIEINGSFYSLQRPEYYRAWHSQTPDDFVFTVKGGRFITHMKRLRGIEKPLANFFASGVLALGEKLGPILWQLPPNMQFDEERFEAFFDLLPRDTASAARLARRHERWLSRRALTRTGRKRRIRHAVEIRHPTFLVAPFIRLLRRHNIALVLADTAGLFPYAEDVTADFVYIRLHGAEQIYVSGYTELALDWWANRIRAWSAGSEPSDAKKVDPRPPRRRRGRDVYVYFDNDAKVNAPFDAIALARRLGLESQSPLAA